MKNLYDYTEKLFHHRGKIPNDVNNNSNCMFLHPDHPFHDKKVVRKRKVAVVPDIIGPRLPSLFEIEEEELKSTQKWHCFC